MTRARLAARSAAFYWRSHLGLGFGAATATAILAGALIIGDSVRGSLRDQALARLAGARWAFASRDRFFVSDLLDRMARSTNGQTALDSWRRAPAGGRGFCALRLPAAVARPDGSARANQVSVFGVDPAAFPELAPASADAVWLNRTLAAQLRAGVGDTVVLRVRKPGALSGDAAITPRDDSAVALRLTVAGVLGPKAGGDLALDNNQTLPANAFLPLNRLGAAAGVPGRANLAVVRSPGPGPEPNGFGAALARSFAAAFTIADGELEVRIAAPARASAGETSAPAALELISRRIFIDAAAAPLALAVTNLPGVGVVRPTPIATYLVNALEAHGLLTPYSMVTAAGLPYTAPGLRDDEMIIIPWLADDLRASAGDEIRMSYYQVDSAARLAERVATFKVAGVVTQAGVTADRTLMPEFPGVSKAESTHDWNAGFDLVHPLRDVDEAYWKRWRGAPKAFISPGAGRRLWGNRFGDWTAIRWFPSEGATTAELETAKSALEEFLRSKLGPGAFGFAFVPVAEQALSAASDGQDFGGLFIGFSFFLIIAALLLAVMLFRFALDQRAAEAGLLMAVGWSPPRVRATLLSEGVIIAAIGSAVGSAAGAVYARGVLLGLATIWTGAVAGARLELHLTGGAVLGGAALGFVCASVALWFSLLRLARRPLRDLLADGRLDSQVAIAGRPHWPWTALAVIGLGGGLAWGAAEAASGRVDPGAVFGSGALLLVGGAAGLRIGLATLSLPGRKPAGINTLALRSLARRPSRTLGASLLLASAAFLLGAIGANKKDAARDANLRSSGAGGFAFWAQASLPIHQDLNTSRGQDFFGLDRKKLAGFSVAALRVRDGDEASCLNLNLASHPRLLGVEPEALAQRGAFTFTAAAPGADLRLGWKLLEAALPDDGGVPTIAAVGDAEALQWILKKNLGDTIDYTDERGRPFKVRLVAGLDNSVLQGSLVIAESQFVRFYPGESGYRALLVDAPALGRDALAGELGRGLRDVGLEVTPAAVRLAAFTAVQNTYLDTFAALGALGLLLGSVGLGVVVRRNLRERRGELALLTVVGYSRARIFRLTLVEHGALLASGLGIGAVAAMPALLPAALHPGPGAGWLPYVFMLAAVALNGFAWCAAGARSALKAPLLDGLRET